MDASIVLQGISENDIQPDSRAARDFCEGIEAAAGLPQGSCSVTGVAPASLIGGGSNAEGGDSGPSGASGSSGSSVEVTFSLRLGPAYMPDQPEEDVAAAVEGALQEAAESGGLLQALIDAGEQGGPLADSLTGVGGVSADALPGLPSPSSSPSTMPTASPTPSVSPSPAPFVMPVPGGKAVRLPLPGMLPGNTVLLARSQPGQLLRLFRTPEGYDPTPQGALRRVPLCPLDDPTMGTTGSRRPL